jgi:hypothetical protein
MVGSVEILHASMRFALRVALRTIKCAPGTFVELTTIGL